MTKKNTTILFKNHLRTILKINLRVRYKIFIESKL